MAASSHFWIGPRGQRRLPRSCCGQICRTVFDAVRPPVFTDAVVGGGTSVGVGPEMGIEAHGLDLHSDFNILSARS